jgi:Protein of unknown function (DUF664)
MPMPAPGVPSSLLAEPVDLLFGYLDYFEDVTLRKIGGLTEDQLRHSSVPSGWTPLGMIKHLAGTERFWIRHVFLGEQIDFADDPASEWRIEASGSTDSVIAFYCSERRSHVRCWLAFRLRHLLSGRFARTAARRRPLPGFCFTYSRPPPGTPATWASCGTDRRHSGQITTARSASNRSCADRDPLS